MRKFDIVNQGISQGDLAMFMECREKMRWKLLGFMPKEPSFPLTFGTVVHDVIELVSEDVRTKKIRGIPKESYVKSHTVAVERRWKKEYPRASAKALQDLELSLLFAEAVMPTYFQYWHEDLAQMNWLSLESFFDMPYVLPDGRKTRLKGRFDGFFEKKGMLWLSEHKTKSRIEEGNLIDILPFDLQTNLYIHVLRRTVKRLPHGTLYDIIRRPGLKQGKGEPMAKFAKRCADDVKERPDWYFIQFEIRITSREMDKWDLELQDLIKDFYDWWEGKAGHYRNPGACETKYGRCPMLDACAGRTERYIRK